jgi:four helix bundle protein
MPTTPDHSGLAGPRRSTQVEDDHAHDHVPSPRRTPGSRRTGDPDFQAHALDDVQLDFQKLDCYQVALQFNTLATRLIPRGHRDLRDQLSRASLSIVLNCAESTGRHAPADKAHFFAIARGSAMECAATVDVLLSSGIVSIGICREARALLIRIVQMLTKLEARFRADAGR